MGNPGKFIVYKSSAGSGKTFTLVREYLSIALKQPDQFRNILAVTFTNKAANELKERVVGYLAALQEPESHKDSVAVKYLLPLLVADTGLKREEIVTRSGLLLQRVMHEYSDYSIGTIDSFMHRVIRNFSFDLKRPFDFEVELDIERMLTQVINLMISRAGAEEALTEVLVDFIEWKAGDDRGWNIDKELLEMAKVLMDEDSQRYLPEVLKLGIDDFSRIKSSIGAYTHQIRQKLRKLGEKALAVIDRHGIERNGFYHGKAGIGNYLESLAGQDWNKIRPNSYASETINNSRWYSGSAAAANKMAIDKAIPELAPIISDIRQVLDGDIGRYTLFGLIERNLLPLAVLSEIERELEGFKKENKIVVISEFNRLIHDVVKDQPVPFIYERVGERYHHFLLDEFQDTSVMQWQNILPLVENGLGDNHASLVVGDGKQAIYRWRSGDVEQFEALPLLLGSQEDRLLAARQEVLKRNFTSRHLKENYRSKPVVIDFNNEFFSLVQQFIPMEYRGIYDDVKQKKSVQDGGGLVRIELIDEKAHEDYFMEVFQRTKNVLGELSEDGYSLNDVAILFRDNARASMMAARLLQEGINVVSAESLLLKFSSRVNFIISWMKFLVDPQDEVSLFTIAHFLAETGWISKDDLTRLLEIPGAASGILDPGDTLEVMISRRSEGFSLRDLRTMGAFSLTEKLVRIFQLDRPADPYIQFFQDSVLKFTRYQLDLLEEFLLWWELEKENASVVIPEGIDAVRIMTIHKAKGLEFPVVILPFADESNRLTKKSRWVPFEDPLVPGLKVIYLPLVDALKGTSYEDVLGVERSKTFVDRLNVLYVAMTRPKERLYVMTRLHSGKVKEPDTYSRMFTFYLRSKGFAADTEQSYDFGKRNKRAGRAREKYDQGAGMESYAGQDWTKNAVLRLRSGLLWDAESAERSVEWGNLVHEVLSGIRYAGDMDFCIAEALNQGLAAAPELGTLRRLITRLLSDPSTKRFYSEEYEVLNEQEIIDRNGLPHRPDRILVKGNIVILIDYKTGDRKSFHADQLKAYAGLLGEMGYAVEGAFLFYLGDNVTLVEVEL